jgi:iron complex outermembrane receptor protein
MKAIFLGSAAFAAGLFLAGGALAQNTAETRSSSPKDEEIERVLITGQRDSLKQPVYSGALGQRSILDTPFSLSVVDAEEIAARQPLSIAQLFVNDPSVFSFASAGTVNWWGTQIRGIGTRNYYVDDVPLVLYWGGDYPLEGIETVEALKGATGFMYGFGAPGGVLSYRSKRPTDAPLLATTLGFRGRSVFTGHIDAGGPIGDDGLKYRLNLAGAKGEEYNQSKIARGLGALSLAYDILPGLTWRVDATHEDYELKAEPFHIYWLVPSQAELPKIPDGWDNLHIDNSFYRYDLWATSTHVDWRLNQDWSVNAYYGYTRKLHESNKTFIELYDRAGDYNGNVYQFAELDENHIVQGMVQGALNTGPVRHEFVVGAAFQYLPSDFSENYVYSNDFNGNIFQPQTYVIPTVMDFDGPRTPYAERQTAVFASDTLHVGEHWQAIVGLRHTYYDLEDLDGDPTTASGYSTSALTPTLALLYKPDANSTLYASYVESLEGGTIVSPLYANFGEVLPASVSKQWEIGAKFETATASFTAAGFHLEQASQIDQLIGGLRYLSQDGLTVYDGIELTARYRATENLTLGLGAVFLDPSLQTVSQGNEALKGNRPAEAYKYQFVGDVTYRIPGVRGLTVYANARYSGDAPTDDTNALIIPGYTLVGAGIGYDMMLGGRDVTLALNINNLLDEKYWGLQNFGESRNASLSLTVHW